MSRLTSISSDFARWSQMMSSNRQEEAEGEIARRFGMRGVMMVRALKDRGYSPQEIAQKLENMASTLSNVDRKIEEIRQKKAAQAAQSADITGQGETEETLEQKIKRKGKQLNSLLDDLDKLHNKRKGLADKRDASKGERERLARERRDLENDFNREFGITPDADGRRKTPEELREEHRRRRQEMIARRKEMRRRRRQAKSDEEKRNMDREIMSIDASIAQEEERINRIEAYQRRRRRLDRDITRRDMDIDAVDRQITQVDRDIDEANRQVDVTTQEIEQNRARLNAMRQQQAQQQGQRPQGNQQQGQQVTNYQINQGGYSH